MTWSQELLVVCQLKDFPNAHFPDVSAPQEDNQKLSELSEGSCHHFETNVPVIQLHHLSAVQPAPIAAGPWHLPVGLVCLYRTPQCRRGIETLFDNAWWLRKICRTKLCPVCQVQNQWPFFPSLSFQSASTECWPQLLLCSHE